MVGLAFGLLAFVVILALPVPSGLYPIGAKQLSKRLPKEVVPLALGESLAERLTEEGLAKLQARASAVRVAIHWRKGTIVSLAQHDRLAPAKRKGFAKVSVWHLVEKIGRAARAVLAVAALMIIFWVFAVLPTAITALLPLVLFPLLGVASLTSGTFPTYFPVSMMYAHHLIFLFMGTFILSQAMTLWRLDHRIANQILRIFGSRPGILMLGFVLASAFLSMWITNTATTAILVPTAVAVLQGIKHPQAHRYQTGVLLCVAYSATVGGIGTLVGTAPNAIYAGFASTLAGHQVSFAEWMGFGLPFVIIFIPLLWATMAWRYIPKGLRLPERGKDQAPSAMVRGEKQVAFVFLLMVSLWLTRGELAVFGWPGWSSFSFGPFDLAWANDSAVAMFGALLLFALPVDLGKRKFTLDLETGLDISWGTLLLFGGGLALGNAIASTGLAVWFAQLLQVVAKAGPHVLILSVALMTSLMTEVTSNTATATMLMPVMYALGQSLGGKELTFMATAAVATSMAFMSPIGTPPNAIVYGTGKVTMGEMFRAGVILNFMAVFVWWIVATWVIG